ncbi:MAG TPA: RDD family protein [Sphingomicrobium sp.]|nr:RDD family protein [Sphingomicrobium sp.]
MATDAVQLRSLKRTFITPEGVDLRLELGSAGNRAAAFIIDFLTMIFILVAVTMGLLYIAGGGGKVTFELIGVLWLLGFFVLRNGWFSIFEMGSRGATPGKRLMGLRVVARDGARLTGSAVIARNAMREIEVFLPLSFLGMQAAEGLADTFLVLFALLWSGIFLFFPLFNRDRLRVGDLVGGTWVVRTDKAALTADLVGTAFQPRRTFSAAALNLYGIYELQTLEEVLRNENPEAIITVAHAIRAKAGIPDDGDDYAFLSDYYAALCAHLERQLMVGHRRESKLG